MSSDQEIRTPRQQRSRARVEAILQASKELIGEKGSAGLKIQEIAKRAGVTAGSMYQYFPNKQAIIQALVEDYSEQIHQMILQALAICPDSLEDCVSTMHGIFDQYYEFYRQDPVMQDVWACIGADKTLEAIDIEDSRRNAREMFDHLKQLFPERSHAGLLQFLFLAMNVSNSTIRLAMAVGKEEGDQLIEMAKQMMSLDVVKKLME